MKTPERKHIMSEMLYSDRSLRMWTNSGEVHKLTPEVFRDPVSIFYMQEHNVAGYVWDLAAQHGVIAPMATLVHVDAHDDMALQHPLPRTINEATIYSYSVGAFIIPRIQTGVIDNVIWLHPKNVHPDTMTATPIAQGASLRYPNSLRSPDLRGGYHVMDTSDLPKVQAELLDIDLDYFTKKYPEETPDFVLRALVARDLKEILRRVSGVRIITVALSPGYIRYSDAKPVLEEALRVLSG